MSPLSEKRLVETVREVTRRGRRFIVRKNGRVVGAIINAKDYQRLQQALEDDEDIRDSRRRVETETPVPYESARTTIGLR